MAIHGGPEDDRVSPTWGIAISAAMGDGIVPRTSSVPLAEAPRRRWPWSRTRSVEEPTPALPRT